MIKKIKKKKTEKLWISKMNQARSTRPLEMRNDIKMSDETGMEAILTICLTKASQTFISSMP